MVAIDTAPLENSLGFLALGAYMFLLTWHVWDKMLEHWSYLSPIGLVGIVTTTLLFLMRRWIATSQ
ncbi:hypothetical protein NIES4072_29640 [Nostoc commune NIES-4072]|uniref:Uncharacterized protein n=1 Tax=Nostoc commune NIES-4072 TaxID=2005467 RepID=A0A2R5FKJ9_NOSCO|nr:hypothetical protein [Nostoc commune]BBD69701.1 hypothetical protein NIES4070_61110 [Nostoc commune HK-02]GBG19297.1 hypothetical protein NIES4072_29640 [Nostoc commune NIES-4072]